VADKAYISNIAHGWSIERQLTMLASSVVGWPIPVYRDEIKRNALTARDPDALEQRGDLLRPTARRSVDTIHVVSLGVLAWRVDDFARVIEALASRKTVITEHHTGLTFDLRQEDERRQIVERFPISRREGSRQKGRLIGAKASAEKRNAASKAAAEAIKDRWGAPGHTASQLVVESGYTYHTMVRWLGKWEPARRRRERNAKRAAAKGLTNGE
jgi:hypothetical protein